MSEKSEKKGRRAEPMVWMAMRDEDPYDYYVITGQPDGGFNRRDKAEKWLLENGEHGVEHHLFRQVTDKPATPDVEVIRKGKLVYGKAG